MGLGGGYDMISYVCQKFTQNGSILTKILLRLCYQVLSPFKVAYHLAFMT